MGAAAVALVAISGAANADPMFPSLALAPVNASGPAAAPEAPAFDLDAPVFFESGGLDIVDDPLYAANSEWEQAPGTRPSFAEMREQFETGDTPQITLTRFVID